MNIRLSERLPIENRLLLIPVAGFAFLFLILVYFVTSSDQNALDQAVFAFCNQFASPLSTRIAKIITFCGTGGFLVPAYGCIVWYLIRNGEKRFAALTTVIATSGLLLGWLLKDLFHRSRPPYHLVNGAGGYSFPSGHAMGGFIFSAILLSVLWKSALKSRHKYLFSILVCLFGVAIGVTRIYLHVHFASDVLGALLIALFWFFLLIFIYRFLYHEEEKRESTNTYHAPAEYLSGNYNLN